MTTDSLRATEALGAEGATAPRITLEYITGQIGRVYYIDGQTLSRYASHVDTLDKVLAPSNALQLVTVCMLVLKSGFVLIGRSVPMSAENYDAGKGRIFAYEDCVRQCWPLFAFVVKQGKVSP